MDLHSGAPFWLMRHGLEDAQQPLSANIACDVVVVGAGVTGALVTDALTRAGMDVVVLDRRQPGAGSTAASTALLQYELDVELQALAEMVGVANAARAYQLCRQAILTLESLCAELGGCGFQMRTSVYLASTRRDARRLVREVEARERADLPTEWWSAERVAGRYGFPSHGAIVTPVAAEVDPLLLTRALLARAAAAGSRRYGHTRVVGCDAYDGRVVLVTDRSCTVTAKRIVYAMGYEIPAVLRDELVMLHSSYAVASEQVDDFGPWDDRCLVWESARPYAYLRTTMDNRVLIGGEDIRFRDAGLRDRLLPRKQARLEKRRATLLPSLTMGTAFSWAGTFGETSDGLPYIGGADRFPGALFALGYGGNGITYSVIASQLIADACCGRPNADAPLFALDRAR